MKFFIILALAFVGALAAPLDDIDVAGDVTEAIKKILDALPEPLIDAHGKTDLALDLGFEKLKFTSYDIDLAGIKALDITTMKYDSSSGRLDYVLTLDNVKANVEFDLLLSGLLEADNHPIVQVILNGLKLSGFAVVDTSASPKKVTDFKLLVTLDASKVDLKGILNDDALSAKLETILNEKLPSMVNDIAAQLEPAVSPILKNLLNFILSIAK